MDGRSALLENNLGSAKEGKGQVCVLEGAATPVCRAEAEEQEEEKEPVFLVEGHDPRDCGLILHTPGYGLSAPRNPTQTAMLREHRDLFCGSS